MFPLELIRRQSIDVELPDLASLTGPAALLGGVDWGATTDRSAVMAIARIPIALERERRADLSDVPCVAAAPLRAGHAAIEVR